MEILIKNIFDIKNKKLSLSQRGILITILLCKDESKKIVWARFKECTKVDDNTKLDLIELQEKGLIKWDGYKSAKKKVDEMGINPDVIECINFLNNLYGTTYKHTTEANVKDLRNRLKEEGKENVKKVIANRYEVWKNDSFMKKYLTPTTIFRASKFPKYLEEALRTKIGESIMTANKLDLKKGDLFTLDHIDFINKNDTYDIKEYVCNVYGNKKGSGIDRSLYGYDLVSLIKKQERIKKRNGTQERVYAYEPK